MIILTGISWLAALALFGFVTLSLASGLLFLAEVIEEHTKLGKLVGRRAVYAIITLLLLMTAFDSLPLYLAASGILSHIIYLLNFSKSWPKTSLSSPSFLLSVLCVCVNHYINFRYFAHSGRDHTRNAYRGYSNRTPPASKTWYNMIPTHDLTFREMSAFFAICVWTVPLFLFLSLSANDLVLPSLSTSDSAPSLNTKSSRPSLKLTTSSNSVPQYLPSPSSSSLISTTARLALSFFPSFLSRSKSKRYDGIIISSTASTPQTPAAVESAQPSWPVRPSISREASYNLGGMNMNASPTSPGFMTPPPPLSRNHCGLSAVAAGSGGQCSIGAGGGGILQRRSREEEWDRDR